LEVLTVTVSELRAKNLNNNFKRN